MFREEALDLLEHLEIEKVVRESTAHSQIAGKTFVITGTLPHLSRDEARALIERHGGKVSGSVSKNTNFLLAGNEAGSKLKKAQDLGIPILDESQLKQLLEEV